LNTYLGYCWEIS